jgi:hypothetical protein
MNPSWNLGQFRLGYVLSLDCNNGLYSFDLCYLLASDYKGAAQHIMPQWLS